MENIKELIESEKSVEEILSESFYRVAESIERGDMVHIPSENKSGVALKVYGQKIHVKFPDDSEKTYDKKDVEVVSED